MLGHDRVVLRERAVVGKDDYGNDVLGSRDRLMRWCLVTPTRSTESADRTAPSLAGATLLAPKPPVDMETVDAIVWPITGVTTDDQGRVTYQGREWEIVGDVGLWPTYVEAQMRRLT